MSDLKTRFDFINAGIIDSIEQPNFGALVTTPFAGTGMRPLLMSFIAEGAGVSLTLDTTCGLHKAFTQKSHRIPFALLFRLVFEPHTYSRVF